MNQYRWRSKIRRERTNETQPSPDHVERTTPYLHSPTSLLSSPLSMGNMSYNLPPYVHANSYSLPACTRSCIPGTRKTGMTKTRNHACMMENDRCICRSAPGGFRALSGKEEGMALLSGGVETPFLVIDLECLSFPSKTKGNVPVRKKFDDG